MYNKPKHELRTPSSTEEWQAYHSIRRKVLFENRGQFSVYDKNHPDEHSKGNHPNIYPTGVAPTRVVVNAKVTGAAR